MDQWQPTAKDMASLEALFQQGRYQDLAGIAEKLTQRFPKDGFGWNVLAVTLSRMGRGEKALPAARTAAALLPASAEAQNNLGAIYLELRQPKEAEIQFRRALALEPGNVVALTNLSRVLIALGRSPEAEGVARRAVELNPNSADAHLALGNAFLARRSLLEAERSFRQVLSRQPNHAAAYSNLGGVQHDLGRFSEAEASFRRALSLAPDDPIAHNNLALILKLQGRAQEAVTHYRRAIALKPSYTEAHSNLLQCLNYLPGISSADLLAEHRRWNDVHGSSTPVTTSDPDRTPRRRLRVGYVSPDLRQHSVAYFFEPLLRAHDPTAVEVYCYAEVPHSDEVTARLKAHAHHWVTTVGLTDRELAERIAADRIDILVDLAGHTANNRLAIFALKPAPVQVSWLGYPATTGLRAMDYRLVDEITDPRGVADEQSVERLVRLEHGFLCYSPPAITPTIRHVDRAPGEVVTFGSFNLPAKLSAPALEAWAKILLRTPSSRLLLKGTLFGDPGSRAGFLERLRHHGIAPERAELRGWTSSLEDHLGLYEQIDVALDPFPYNGTTTTCEALWMGVPVITLLGNRHAARVGASLLTQIGVKELITDSVEAYIEVATRLASDQKRLIGYRQNLRTKMAQSPLCDAQAFARKIEAAYREMWQTFCQRPTGGKTGAH